MAKARFTIPAAVARMPKVELHQHVDGSIPPPLLWRMLRRHELNPVSSLREMRKRLELQADEEGSLLAYLDKFHYPLWITQFYENLLDVAESIVRDAISHGVRVLELRYSPVIHTYGGLTVRQAIRAILSGINRGSRNEQSFHCGLVIIAMRQHGPHIAKILARQAIAEAEHLHKRCGVVGFDIAGPERGNPPRLFGEAFSIAQQGRIGITAHAGEDASSHYIWEAIEHLGATRIGHACSAVGDRELLRRLAKDKILVECCPTSNYQTGAVKRGQLHPLLTFLEHDVPVAICTDNTTVSRTNQDIETALAASWFERSSIKTVRRIHQAAAKHSFIAAARGG